MIKYLELAVSQEVYEYLEELDEMNWSARGNVLNQYLSNTSTGTTVICLPFIGDTSNQQFLSREYISALFPVSQLPPAIKMSQLEIVDCSAVRAFLTLLAFDSSWL
jgi:hypothetical protein